MRTVENEIANKMSSVDTADASEYFFLFVIVRVTISKNANITEIF